MKKIVFSAALTAVIGWVAFLLVNDNKAKPMVDGLASEAEASQAPKLTKSGEPSTPASRPETTPRAWPSARGRG